MNFWPSIAIVHEDDAVRDSLRLLLESQGLNARDYGSAAAFLSDSNGHNAACLVVGLHLSEMSGLELVEFLRARRVAVPALVVTGWVDPTLAGRMERAGVLALLTQPLAEKELFRWIECALRDPSVVTASSRARSDSN